MSSDPIAREVRSLPSAPSLEYERKEAKALLKQIHAGAPDALERVRTRHPASLRDRPPEKLKLSDAQHVIAREYGFASWPRLVDYFAEMERHRSAPRFNSGNGTVEWYERWAQDVVRRHARGDAMVARELARFVPRFHARPTAEILATPVTEDEARLVVARRGRRVSWDELIERTRASEEHKEERKWEGRDTPRRRARDAIFQHDLEAVAALLDEHPELLTPTVIEREWRVGLAGLALHAERESGDPEARRVTELLASRGVDVQRELNERLLGWPHVGRQLEPLRWYLERGADPNWVPPNGIPVLEHAIVRYRDGECVDLIAARVTPRRALWIAAGLGDAAGVRTFIASKGKLTREGRRDRPDLLAMGAEFGREPPNHEADDLEIMWEAFQVAGWNGRWEAMDALLEAGLPVDHAPHGVPLLIYAISELRIPLLKYLVARGADLDREWEWQGRGTGRSFARGRVKHCPDPHIEEARRLLELCQAGTIEEVLAEMDAERPSPPPPDLRATRIMQLAADDAARRGQSNVTTGNMLVGLLRYENGQLAGTFMGTGADMPKLRELIGGRLLPDEDPLLGQELPADEGATAALRAAVAKADSHRSGEVTAHYLLWGILSEPSAPGARLLADIGASVAELKERLSSP